MITPLQGALLCQEIYDPQVGQFDRIVDTGSVVCGINHMDGFIILTFRGSKVLEDFIHDAEGIIPLYVPMVGTVAEGFYVGVPESFEMLGSQAGDVVCINGHSLGCAHGAYIARLCLLRGIRVAQLYMYEPPRAGCADFVAGLRNVQDLRAYKNRNDPVTEVPITTPEFPVVQFPLIWVDGKPDGWTDGFADIDDHLIENLIRGIEALPG